jgi:hypothetical protein
VVEGGRGKVGVFCGRELFAPQEARVMERSRVRDLFMDLIVVQIKRNI